MTTFNNAEVLARMNRALSGEGAGDEQVELPVQAYAWRMLRWEADIPMSDEQREQLHTFIEGSMRLAGGCVYRTTRTR